MKAFLMLYALLALFGPFEVMAGAPPGPDNHWWCQAIGYRETEAVAVLGGEGWTSEDAGDMAMYQCRDVQHLEGCYVESCWVP